RHRDARFRPTTRVGRSSSASSPSEAPPVAFVAGVVGSLVGADLLHLADVRRIGAGMASIGERGHSTASYSQASLPPISSERQHFGAFTPLRNPLGRNHAPAQLNRGPGSAFYP